MSKLPPPPHPSSARPHPPPFLPPAAPAHLLNPVTLVPHEGSPKIRNLQLGNGDVDIKNAEHSPASESAHEYAEIMGAAPADGVMEAPYV